MAQFLVTTTGTVPQVIFNDLGARTLVHPTVDLDLLLEFSSDEISNSKDVQSAIDAGEITVQNEFGQPIDNVSDSVSLVISAGTNINITGSEALSIINTTLELSATTLSAATIFSGGTDLSAVVDNQINAAFSAVSISYFDAYDAAGGTITTSNSWVATVPLDTQRIADSAFTHDTVTNNDEVAVNEDFIYFIIGRVSTEASGSNSRTQGEARLELDTGGGFVEVPGTVSEMYLRQANYGATATFFAILNLNSGNKLRLAFRRETGGTNVRLEAGGSSLAIVKMQAIKGEKGDKGDTGNAEAAGDLFVSGTVFSDIYSGNTTEAIYYGDGSNLTNTQVDWGNINADINNQTDLIQLLSAFSGGTYAFGEIQSDGTLVHGTNLTVNRFGAGMYEFPFIAPAPNTDYVVNATFNGNASNVQDWTAVVTTKANTGFTITTTSQDNGGTADPPTDLNFELAVFGPPGATPQATGLPSGGNTGDILVKTSGNDYDVSWTIPVLSGQTDVNFTGTPQTNDILFYDGSHWNSGAIKNILDVSVPSIEVYALGNLTTTVISAINTPVKVQSDNYSVDFATSFTESSGTVTYTGDSKIRVAVDATVYFQSNNNQDVNFYIALNTGATFNMIASSQGFSRTQGSSEITFANPRCLVEIKNGDQLELYVENTSSTSNVLVNGFNLTINT